MCNYLCVLAKLDKFGYPGLNVVDKLEKKHRLRIWQGAEAILKCGKCIKRWMYFFDQFLKMLAFL